MDFFDREARAQQQTRLLLWLFGLAVLAVVMLAYLVFALLAHVFERSIFFEHLSNIQLFCYSTIATLILIAEAAITKCGCSPAAVQPSRKCLAEEKLTTTRPT